MIEADRDVGRSNAIRHISIRWATQSRSQTTPASKLLSPKLDTRCRLTTTLATVTCSGNPLKPRHDNHRNGQLLKSLPCNTARTPMNTHSKHC